MVKIIFNNQTVQSHLIGIYNANNINAAITIGNYFKVSDELIKEAIEKCLFFYTRVNYKFLIIIRYDFKRPTYNFVIIYGRKG